MTKDKCRQALNELYVYAIYNANRAEKRELKADESLLKQLINEYFKLIEKDEA